MHVTLYNKYRFKIYTSIFFFNYISLQYCLSIINLFNKKNVCENNSFQITLNI